MEATVQHELSLFLNNRIPAESLSSVDDIVLGYIVSVLKQLGEDEQFDVDEFAEIMAAYIPGFDTVNREDVCSWMLGLAEKLVNTRTSINQIKEDDTLQENEDCRLSRHSSDRPTSLRGQLSCISNDKTPLSSGSTSTCQSQESEDATHVDIDKKRMHNASDGLSVLAEMFPKACSLEIEHCLMVANGDTESAAQLLLLKNENNDEKEKENCHGIVDLSPKVHCPSAKRQELEKTERENHKEQMMAKYGYVDVSQDEKTHQPTLHKQENKKLTRYRDNQVVSTKGERFSWVKEQESDEMKKTYVNLKPARKYRFH